jgi:hypothetical protein
LLEQPKLRLQFAKASRQIAVENFDLSIIAMQTRDVYNKYFTENNQVPVVSSAKDPAT